MSSELKDPAFHARLKQIIGDEKPFAWADRIGISKGAFSRVWNEGTVPGPEHLRRIYEKTGVSIDWLLTGEGEMRRGPERGTVAYVLDKEHQAEVNECVERYGVYPLDQGLLKRSLEGAFEWVRDEGMAPEPETIFSIMMYRYQLVATIKFGSMPHNKDVEKVGDEGG